MAADTRPSISVVIPLCNEGSHLESSLNTVCKVLDGLETDYEIVAVDDGSQDDTWQILSSLSQASGRIRAYRLSRRFGKEAALCAGLDQASKQVILVMDGDLQHPPSLIPEMYRTLIEEGCDLVEGVKETRGKESLVTKICARSFYRTFRWLTSFDLQDASDFKLMNQNVLAAWREMPERGVFFRGMCAWLGFKRKQLLFTVADSARPVSRWSKLQLLQLAITGITSFATLPIHLITVIGVFFLLLSGVLGVIAMIHKLTGVASTGFTTVIMLQLIVGGMIIVSLGVIGQYIAKIHDEVKCRPRYVVAEASTTKDSA